MFLGALRREIGKRTTGMVSLSFFPFSCGKRSPFLDKKEGSVPYLIWCMMTMIVYLPSFFLIISLPVCFRE